MSCRGYTSYCPLFFSEIQRISDKWAATLRSRRTKEESAANVARFDKFGELNIIDSLAGGDILNYEKVEKLDVATAWAKLYLEKEKIEYQRALQKNAEKDARKNSKRNRR